MIFWIVTGILALLVAALLSAALLRRRPAEQPAAAYDLQVYRDQLKEVDRDLARGVIDAADAERVRAEVSRRLLAADAQVKAFEAGTGQGGVLSGAVAMGAAVVLIGGSLLLYLQLGAPGYGDLGLKTRVEIAELARASRPSQADAEASIPARPNAQASEEYLDLMERLRNSVAERPDDLQGHILLAQNEATLGNFAAAHVAQARVIALKGDAATVADHADYADMLILAAGGYVSPTAEAALAKALEQDPRNGPARYYWGLMMGQTGRPDVAFRVWDNLLKDSLPDAPWVPPIRGQIEDMAMRAGVNYQLPSADAPLRGPSQEDMEAASEMSAEDRAEMIRGMVQGLSDRLATEGGPPPEWARLISALAVLGDLPQAQAVYDNAIEVFADDRAALALLEATAAQAGLNL